LKNGVVCASAGNHAQGVAFSCNKLQIHGKIFMPLTTPSQKVKQVKMFGKQFVEVIMIGESFDEANLKAIKYSKLNNMAFIPPFDDMKIIEGQGTIGIEIMESMNTPIDYIFVPIGGGGLAAGLGSYIKQISPNTKIIGVEPEGASSMIKSFQEGKVTPLETIDTFVDGAAVLCVGTLNYGFCKQVIDDIVAVPEGKVCSMILKLYNEEAIVVEPAGALSLSALDYYREQIKGKNVVCVVSGGNNDIARTGEIIERSLLYEGLKHYFLIRFPQHSGALKNFIINILGPTDDITLFEYQQKTNREIGPALVGIVVNEHEDFDKLVQRLKDRNIKYEYINENMDLFRYIL
jgi:threonine dehydratase